MSYEQLKEELSKKESRNIHEWRIVMSKEVEGIENYSDAELQDLVNIGLKEFRNEVKHLKEGIDEERKRICKLIKKENPLNYSVPESINIFKKKILLQISGTNSEVKI